MANGKEAGQLNSRPPYERMMFIHEQLKKGAYPNCTQVCKQFELDRRTILRDIEFMKDNFSLPIGYDRQRQGYYYTRRVDQFPSVTLSESELFAMLVAQKAVAGYEGTSFHRPLAAAFKRLTQFLGDDAVVHLRDLGQALDIRLSGPDSIDEENFQIVLRAVQQRRPLSFDYRKQASKSVERRTAHPYQLVCSNNRWYVIAHDPRRQAMRIFVLSRMAASEIMPGEFQRPADFKIDDYLKGSFGIFRGEGDYEVVVALDAWAADVLRSRRWHPSQELCELPGGGMRVSFRLDNLEEIEGWVLAWGVHATVVRPKALAARVLAAAQGIVERYAGSPSAVPEPAQNELGLKPNPDAQRP